MRPQPYLRSATQLKEGGQTRAWRERLESLTEGSLLAKATILVVLMGVIRIALRPAELQHDVAMYLQAGQLLLRGQRPYVDFIDVNPPLIVYLSAIPAAVSALLRTPIAPTALLMTSAAAMLSLAAVRRELTTAFRGAGDDSRIAEVAVLALALALFLSDFPERLDLPFPGNAPNDPRLSAIFGQREHLFVIGTAPLLALRFARRQGEHPTAGRATLFGVIASLVACLKPQLLLALAAFEVGLADRKRWLPVWGVEVIAFAAGVLAYVAHFALLPGAVRAAWFGRWLPFVIQGYGVFNEPSPWASIARSWPALLAVAAGYGLLVPSNASGQKLIRAFASMAVAGALLYVLQKKGWTYHAYPERVAVAVTLACTLAAASSVGLSGDAGCVVVLPFTRRRCARLLLALVALTGVACAVCLLRIDTPSDVDRLRRRSQVMRTIDTFTKEGDPVLVATTSVWDPYPALTLQNRAPGSRYLWLFPIPMMQAVSSGDAEGAFVRDLAEDIRERRPTLILLQTGRCFGCRKTSVDAFFREHAPLAAALEDYSLRGSVHDGQELQVFVRVR